MVKSSRTFGSIFRLPNSSNAICTLLTLIFLFGLVEIIIIHYYLPQWGSSADISINQVNNQKQTRVIIQNCTKEKTKSNIKQIKDDRNTYIKYETYQTYQEWDFSYVLNEYDGSPYYFDTSNMNNIKNNKSSTSFVFCPIPKSGSTIWKQIFRRMKGLDYLNNDHEIIHDKNANGLNMHRLYHTTPENATNNILRDPNIYHAVFIRDPLERALSAFLDKCHRSEWKRSFCIPQSQHWNKKLPQIYSLFEQFVNDITSQDRSYINDNNLIFSLGPNCNDLHSIPQNWFCDLYKYYWRYHIYHSKNLTHSKLLLQKLNLWQDIGQYGWYRNDNSDDKNNDDTSILRYSVSHKVSASKKMFSHFTPSTVAKLISFYKNDFEFFNFQISNFVCHLFEMTVDEFQKNNFDWNEMKKQWNNNNNDDNNVFKTKSWKYSHDTIKVLKWRKENMIFLFEKYYKDNDTLSLEYEWMRQKCMY